ncbi:TIGR03826 family flagellar region protein [Paenibacillus sp. GCM10027626]|uniref:TIGR03826 family flagellar region protein n=1 Tax=Paenibacillus sp. GCM10027626 TaxID=3273411 RepID=UPI0036295A89
MELDNCPRCGKLFAKNFRELCPACIKDVDREYTECAEYLRKNKGATIHELSDATNVSIKQITKFIREGRISLVGAPNLGYPCEVCGIPIREGNLCGNCRSRLQHDIGQAQGKLAKDTEGTASAVYRIMDRLRDRS